MSASRGSRGERGMILIAVLLAVAIMAVMVVAATALTRAGIGSEELEKRRLATHFALRSSLETAKALILAASPENRMYFDGTPQRLDVGSGISATVSIRDAAALVDVNRSDPALIGALARASGLSGQSADQLAGGITQLRKEAAPELAQKAAAQPLAASQPPPKVPVQPGQKPKAQDKPGDDTPPVMPVVFQSVEQLGDLASLASEEGKSFVSGLTVFNPTGKLNPYAAPDDVLRAVPGISGVDIATIADAKKKRAAKPDARVGQIAERLKPFLALKDPAVFEIDVRLDDGAGILTGAQWHGVVRIAGEGPLPFRTLASREE